MQKRKKCEQCNTLNDLSQIYCINCGKYLRGKVVKKDNKITIWGIDESPVIDNGHSGNSHKTNQKSNRYIVICPECSGKSNAENGVLPLSCSTCGHFFQAGIDKIISESDLGAGTGTKSTQKNSDPPKNDPNIQGNVNIGSGPLKRALKDTSSLRLSSISSNSILPEMMKEAGNIIGKNGTVFRGLKTNQQISIWHTSTGWYARATMGIPLFNGVPMNQGVQVKLTAGDLLVIEQEQFMVEII